jgi:hypothetical protein
MAEDDGSRRLELVRTALQQWIEALTDLGGRNTRLYYKDRRATPDSETLPTFANQVEAARAGLRRREDFAAQAGLMRLFAGIEQTPRTFDPAVYAS